MLKPFFINPFPSMATRTGIPVGHAAERVMLDALGGSNGFRNRFQRNADGTTTMLKTKGGMPRFITQPKKKDTWLGFDGFYDVFATFSGGIGTHNISLLSETTADVVLPFSIVPATGIAGVDYSMAGARSDIYTVIPSAKFIPAVASVDYTPPTIFSSGVTLSGGNITIPVGVIAFNFQVSWVNDPSDKCKVYKITIGGNVRHGYYAAMFI